MVQNFLVLLGFPSEDFDRIEVYLFDGSSLRFLALAHPDLTTLPPGSTLYVREMQEAEQADGSYGGELAIDESGHVMAAFDEHDDIDLGDALRRREPSPAGEWSSRCLSA